jgi:6-phosphogluconolactonase
MSHLIWKEQILPFDSRRDIIIPGDKEKTIAFCVQQFLAIAAEAIEKRGQFIVAFSGGQTPHAIFKELSDPKYRSALDWKKVLCFWSDERSVPPNHPDSNYSNAMESGLAKLPLDQQNIFRMVAEVDIEKNARAYEDLIREKVPNREFDLVMLGMGDDGHIASLFPGTRGLNKNKELVIANYVPLKQTWRLSFTYTCIHQARVICIYVLGKSKAKMVALALEGEVTEENLIPAQRVGTPSHHALWVLDVDASSDLHQK